MGFLSPIYFWAFLFLAITSGNLPVRIRRVPGGAVVRALPILGATSRRWWGSASWRTSPTGSSPSSSGSRPSRHAVPAERMGTPGAGGLPSAGSRFHQGLIPRPRAIPRAEAHPRNPVHSGLHRLLEARYPRVRTRPRPDPRIATGGGNRAAPGQHPRNRLPGRRHPVRLQALVAGVCVWLAASPAGAAPPLQRPERVADRSLLRPRASAAMGAVGVDRAEAARAQTTGTYKAVVILLQFTDNRADTLSHTPAAFESLLFSVGTHPTGSMRDYYREVSRGQFDIEGTVTRWYTASQPYSFYNAGPGSRLRAASRQRAGNGGRRHSSRRPRHRLFAVRQRWSGRSAELG